MPRHGYLRLASSRASASGACCGLKGRSPRWQRGSVQLHSVTEAPSMLPLGDLFVEVYVRIADAIAPQTLPLPPRPGPAPACTDAEVLTLALVRHLLARRSERAWLAEVRRDWAHYFPPVPHRSEFNRRVRWLWGAFERLRQQA